MLWDKAQITNNVIKFINNISSVDPQVLEINDWTSFIMDFSRVSFNKNLIKSNHRKCQGILQLRQQFGSRFHDAFQLGLWVPWNDQGWFYCVEIYEEKIEKERTNHEQFEDIIGLIRGIIIFKKLSNDFTFLSILKTIQRNLPLACYDLYTELDIMGNKMLSYKIPQGDDWKRI